MPPPSPEIFSSGEIFYPLDRGLKKLSFDLFEAGTCSREFQRLGRDLGENLWWDKRPE